MRHHVHGWRVIHVFIIARSHRRVESGWLQRFQIRHGFPPVVAAPALQQGRGFRVIRAQPAEIPSRRFLALHHVPSTCRVRTYCQPAIPSPRESIPASSLRVTAVFHEPWS